MEDDYFKELYQVLQKTKKFKKHKFLVLSLSDISNSLSLDNNDKGPNINPNIQFIDFLQKNNIDLYEGFTRLMHPSIIFTAIAMDKGVIKLVDTLNVVSTNHKIFKISTIFTDRFGSYIYNQKMEPIGSGHGIQRFIYNDESFESFVKINRSHDLINSLKRHPQLRRILMKYCQLNNLNFSEYNLKEKLNELDILDHPIYQYYDADEYIMLCNPENTYFDLLPLEIKLIIINYVSVIVKNEKIESNILGRVVSNLIDKQINGFNGTPNIESIGDIYKEFKNDGTLDNMRSGINRSGAEGITDYLNKMGGAANIITSLLSAVFENLEKSSNDTTDDELNELLNR